MSPCIHNQPPVNTEDSNQVAKDLKKNYQAATVLETESALREFAGILG